MGTLLFHQKSIATGRQHRRSIGKEIAPYYHLFKPPATRCPDFLACFGRIWLKFGWNLSFWRSTLAIWPPFSIKAIDINAIHQKNCPLIVSFPCDSGVALLLTALHLGTPPPPVAPSTWSTPPRRICNGDELALLPRSTPTRKGKMAETHLSVVEETSPGSSNHTASNHDELKFPGFRRRNDQYDIWSMPSSSFPFAQL